MADTKISMFNGGTITTPDSDSVLPFVADKSATPSNKITSLNLLSYAGLNAATAITSVDYLNDYIGVLDASGTAFMKTLAKYIRGATNEVSITAAGGWASTTQGAGAAEKYETSVNKMNYYGVPFNDATVTYWETEFTMPNDYDGGALVINNLNYYGSTAQASAVVWGIQAACIAAGGSLDTAWGTPGTITDTYYGTAYLYKYSASGATITPANATAGRIQMRFRVFRNGTIATDTYTGTAYFNAMQMVYTRGSV